MTKANAVIGQSGGPTCAINATLAGVIDALQKSDKISKIFGTVNGINGILSGSLKELNKIFENTLSLRVAGNGTKKPVTIAIAPAF